jgi:YihY family inner membrane protein
MRSWVQIPPPRPWTFIVIILCRLGRETHIIKFIDEQISKADKLQKRHRFLGFTYAVIKKHGEDKGGHLAALLTYYGFLSLFPLLLVGSAILQILSFNDSEFKQAVISHATQYFPVLGQQLQSNLESLGGTKAVLFISIIFTLWGAKGIADIFQFTFNTIWNVPNQKQPGFIKRSLKSLGIIILGGGGFIIAAFLSGFAAGLNHETIYRIIPILISTVLLLCIFLALFKWALASPREYRDAAVFRSALFAAVGTELLQIIGGYLVTRQLGHLNSFYGSFGVTLALLFWIYLQSQVIVYAAEVGSVFDKTKWPRNLS